MDKFTDKMEEVWKDVVGYEGLYQVSSFGRVKSLPKLLRTPSTKFMSSERFLTQSVSKGGYLRVGLTKNGKQKHYFVHRLVVNAFLGIDYKMTVNHKDEDKNNNHIENLEYMTRAENVRYGTGVARSAATRASNPYNGKPVNQYTVDGKFVKRYKFAKQALKENGWGKSSNSIYNSCKRVSHTAFGYIWRFDGDTDVSFKIKKNTRKVTQLTPDGFFVAEYNSINDAAIATKCQKGHICSCCSGKRTKTGNFKWVYSENYK